MLTASLGFTRGDGDAYVVASDTDGTGEVVPCVFRNES